MMVKNIKMIRKVKMVKDVEATRLYIYAGPLFKIYTFKEESEAGEFLKKIRMDTDFKKQVISEVLN